MPIAPWVRDASISDGIGTQARIRTQSCSPAVGAGRRNWAAAGAGPAPLRGARQPDGRTAGDVLGAGCRGNRDGTRPEPRDEESAPPPGPTVEITGIAVVSRPSVGHHHRPPLGIEDLASGGSQGGRRRGVGGRVTGTGNGRRRRRGRAEPLVVALVVPIPIAPTRGSYQ